MLVPAEESLFGFYARFGYRTVFTCRTETVPAARGDCSITPLTPGWLAEPAPSCSSMTAICPIRRSCCAGRKRSPAAAGLAFTASRRAMPVCCAAAERDGETLLVRELLPDCPEAAAALADQARMPGGVLPHGWRHAALRHGKIARRNAAPAAAYLGPAFE